MRRARAWKSGSPGVAEHQVRWSQDVERDLESIVDYIAHESPSSALCVFDRLHKQASRLERFPHRGRRVPEIPARSIPPLRELVIAPWRLIYAIDGDCVLVIALADSRRDIEAWLTPRFGSMQPSSSA